MTDRAIHNSDNEMIGVVSRPAPGHFWAHTIHQDANGKTKRKFRTLWEAANWIHAIHDNEMEEANDHWDCNGYTIAWPPRMHRAPSGASVEAT